MVYIRRITPEDGAARIFKGLTSRVQSLETRPSGNIVVRETLSATDPETGVSVVLGTLPDGSTGLQEFINDVIPPGQPTTPSLAPAIGAVSVAWDGFEAGGTAQPRDYDRTEIMYREAETGVWVLGGVFYGASTTLVPNLTPGVRYDFHLVSYDKNGNASPMSGIVSESAAAIMDNSDVADAIDAVQREAAKASQDSANAQDAAAAAQEAAVTAAEEAAKAAGLAAGGSGIVFSDTAPTDPKDRTENKLWIDTSGTPAKNTPNRWIGGNWVAVTDKAAIDAATKASAAESSANAAAASAAAAAIAAGDARTAANGKNRIWHATSEPAGSAHTVGDTWFNTANGNEPNRWDGGRWVSIRDGAIETATGAANAALMAANGKNKIIFSASDASGTTGYVAGDMWMKRDANGVIIGQWEFTTSWQKRTISETVLGNLSAGKITSGTIGADLLDANTIRSKIIDADAINAVDILASNSITATNGIIGSIDAGKISVGTLDATRIAAQSLTADKVIIGQGTNLITDPAFTNNESNTARAARSTGTWTFQTDTSTGIKSAKTTTATANNAFYFGLPKASAANAANMIPAAPGEKYVFMASVYTDISAGVRWDVELVSADGTTTYVPASPTYTAMGRRKMPAFEYVVPAGVVAFNPVLACLTTGVTWVIDAGAVAARKVEGSLIVDGAIDGKTITGALIQSVSAPSRGIKINDTQFVAYDSVGNETLRLDGSNAIMTGATIRTAATGARIQMSKTGLEAWGADNVRYLKADGDGLELVGTISQSANGYSVSMRTDPYGMGGQLRFDVPNQISAGFIGMEATGALTIQAPRVNLTGKEFGAISIRGGNNAFVTGEMVKITPTSGGGALSVRGTLSAASRISLSGATPPGGGQASPGGFDFVTEGVDTDNPNYTLLRFNGSGVISVPGGYGKFLRLRNPEQEIELSNDKLRLKSTQFEISNGNNASAVSAKITSGTDTLDLAADTVSVNGEKLFGGGQRIGSTLLQLYNNFTHYNVAGWTGVRYRQEGRVVEVTGAFSRSSYSTQEVIGILPVGSRPASKVKGTNIEISSAGELLTVVAGSGPSSFGIVFLA